MFMVAMMTVFFSRIDKFIWFPSFNHSKSFLFNEANDIFCQFLFHGNPLEIHGICFTGGVNYCNRISTAREKKRQQQQQLWWPINRDIDEMHFFKETLN